MMRLHMILSNDPRAWRDCAMFARDGDIVLLVDAASALLADPEFLDVFGSMVDCQGVCALSADIAARGLNSQARAAGTELLSDADWARLVALHEHVLSWK